jgi:hypothetical protein
MLLYIWLGGIFGVLVLNALAVLSAAQTIANAIRQSTVVNTAAITCLQNAIERQLRRTV